MLVSLSACRRDIGLAPATRMKIVIVGGSHAGLLTAIVLDRSGCDVAVFERSPDKLEARGAGLRIQPLMAEMLLRETGIDLAPASTFTHRDRHIGPNDSVIHDAPELGHFVSWGSLTRFLLERFGLSRYHYGESCIGVEPDGATVKVRFASGRTETADLVIFCDGISSTGRRFLLPQVQPQYAGYVAWRGLVTESDLSHQTLSVLEDACTFTVAGLSHMPIYPVPGDDGGGRLWNFIWYRNVAEGSDLTALMTGCDGIHRPVSLPPGLVQEHLAARLRDEAKAQLPPAAAEVLTKAPTLFIQPIFDLLSEPMVFGRCLLVGDAAAVTRPHVGAGSTKPLLAAIDLAAALKTVAAGADLDGELAAWSRKQVTLARDLIARGAMMGRRAQVEGTWRPGLPELSRITLAG